MRYHLVAAFFMSAAAVPAAGQDRPYVEPEISSQAPGQTLGGLPASSSAADQTARIDAMEAQLARLTGQVEEGNYKVRQLETELAASRRAFESRVAALEGAATPAADPAPSAAIARPEPRKVAAAEPASTGPIATGDAGEDAYLTGFRMWEEKQFGPAQKTLEAAAKKYPKHRRASYALNLAGRAYLDDDKPATAAKLLLSNYQTNPKGDRAADSLYFLGQALVQLKKGPEACKVYDELQDVYGPTMRDWLKQRLPKAREDAKCGS